MHDCLRPAPATLSRRTFILQGAGVAAGAALAPSLAIAPAAAASNGGPPVPRPKPIPGGLDIPGIGVIHVFLPGPEGGTFPFSGLPFGGLNVEPSTITDFRGFTALAYLTGQAIGSDGMSYDFESDFRVFRGDYIAQDGSTNVGTFGLI